MHLRTAKREDVGGCSFCLDSSRKAADDYSFVNVITGESPIIVRMCESCIKGLCALLKKT